MRNDPMVIVLVHRAAAGDEPAWHALVERYAPLVWSVCRRYGLSGSDADDAGQNVWLALLKQLPALRDPAALPGWLATTARHECLRVLNQSRRREVREVPVDSAEPAAPTEVDELVLRHELNAAVRVALAELSPACRQLLELLAHDPPLSYLAIAERLGVPVGGLGPRRARCLEKLRRSPQLAALIEDGAARSPGRRA